MNTSLNYNGLIISVVQQLCKNLDNAQDLYSVKKVVEGIKQTHATDLKKNVYKNYGQFIQTSKEITYLEAEMYKLGHLLTEQKALISSLTDDNITSEKNEALDISITEDLSIAKICELVQGAGVLHDIPGRKMIHNGNLVELGEDERHIRLFLMNDCIMSAAPTKSAWMSEAYKMVDLLELKNVTVMDVQDQKLCFKVTQYPANMFLYRAETEQKRIEWVSLIKRAQQDLKEAVGDRPDIELKQSRDEMIEGTWEENQRRAKFRIEALLELPEQLDVCIAQRDFENAVRKLRDAKPDIAKLDQSNHGPEIKARIDSRLRQLTEMLTEVNMGSGMYAHGKASKKPVKQLLLLEKVTQATSLFLRNKSTNLKMSIRRIKMEGTMTLYITKLSQTFFSTVAAVGTEFKAVFSNTEAGCMPSYVSWVESELEWFADMFSRQVFPQGSVVGHGVAGECVSIALKHADQLSMNGLDISFLMSRLLQPGISETLKRNHIQIMEASQLRAKEEHWKKCEFSRQTGDIKKLDDLLKTYNVDLSKYCVSTGDDKIYVTLCHSVISFVRSFHSYLNDAKKMYNVRVKKQLIDSITSCLQFQAFQLKLAPPDEEIRTVVSSSDMFMNKEFIPAVITFLETQVTQQPVPQIRSILDMNDML